jgi:hypothetical protein
MKHYWQNKWRSALFLSAMILIGYAAIPLPGNELFPFYSWSMFAKVPSERNSFAVFIHEVGGQPVTPAKEFQEAGGMVNSPKSVVAHQVIQKLGLAYAVGGRAELADAKSRFEKNYLSIGTRYALVRMNYDPLTRWKNGGRTLETIQEWVRTE